ncbi:hypothetical protein B0J11DRAFT_15914 [Dendryphion nanum]|uniref:Uncharacterized protein n=1 Tax=Dendryphion nanum TaxID=256645 RepID=A0A9P9EIH0_9PLEO|nr:hypothetical protein B0J11DRAFT_15914 [Dendryphion nanum]
MLVHHGNLLFFPTLIGLNLSFRNGGRSQPSFGVGGMLLMHIIDRPNGVITTPAGVHPPQSSSLWRPLNFGHIFSRCADWREPIMRRQD